MPLRSASLRSPTTGLLSPRSPPSSHHRHPTEFLPAFQAALTTLHNQGGALPLLSQPTTLPPSQPGLTPGTVDPMPYLGRTLDIVPAVALADPTTDAIVLVSSAGPSGPFQAAANVLSPGSFSVAPANWTALQCTSTGLFARKPEQCGTHPACARPRDRGLLSDFVLADSDFNGVDGMGTSRQRDWIGGRSNQAWRRVG
ncbi:MAG TPA: hypothetical protein VFE63_09915 [Roseiarcus sp.]|nr:hypothetical protein [Roseiarcus sp.]